jgi:hypothetical protein
LNHDYANDPDQTDKIRILRCDFDKGRFAVHREPSELAARPMSRSTSEHMSRTVYARQTILNIDAVPDNAAAKPIHASTLAVGLENQHVANHDCDHQEQCGEKGEVRRLGRRRDTLTRATEINRMGIAYDPASPIRPKMESGLGPVNGWAITVTAIWKIIQLTSGAANIVDAVMAATERGCC